MRKLQMKRSCVFKTENKQTKILTMESLTLAQDER